MNLVPAADNGAVTGIIEDSKMNDRSATGITKDSTVDNIVSDHPTKPSTASSSFSADMVRDIFLWRRKKLSVSVLSVATATWVLLDVYQFNFVTLASWLAIVLASLLFVYGNLVRLFRKEEKDMSGLEIPEEAAVKVAVLMQESIQEGVRWMFHAGAANEWFGFARVVAALLLLSYVGCWTDLLTLLYTGIVLGMGVPVIYVKNEDNINRLKEWIKMQPRRAYEIVDQKVSKRVKSKVTSTTNMKENKEKKAE